MGAVPWPALSESARASTESSSESPKGRHYPKGNSHAKGTHLAVYLRLVDAKKLHSRSKIFTKFSLRFADHLHSKHCFGKGSALLVQMGGSQHSSQWSVLIRQTRGF
ncbi:hypothetical protein ACFX13_022115 [Malus domestica]|uniref:uncharacterized protein n=1 Tax=Malus domestica TaxID=3750 RepID=UPI0004991B8F|nr:uncharacterized protein LOC103403549 isoform X1 [Malus domestica]XP_050130239.1 uncharacterized protein LOC126606891 isoform X1 [Malus sylvestris]